MSNSYGFGGEEIREESSWRYPLGIFVATLILSAVFLYYYVGPSVEDLTGDAQSPAISDDPVAFTIANQPFETPTNYTVFPRDRRGGDRDEVWLYALWPTMAGYSPARRVDFLENEPDTRRIDILLKTRSNAFTEDQRIDSLYMPQVIDERGSRTPYQLIKYEFVDQRSSVPTNGYAHTELFLGETTDGDVMALMCFKELDTIESPECWREYELNAGISVTYRFKRAYLDEWRLIDERIRSFMSSMQR
ncbi:MAG: hypothetical protein AAF850_13245 [Pseudomonadota bacterium]